jgi:glycine oxidase
LRDAQELVPAVAELELIEMTARARPGTPDNAPLLGRVADAPGLVIATGFFRHGVLLTPIAAQICLDILDGDGDDRWTQFRPDRFSVTDDPIPLPKDRIPNPHRPMEPAHD